MKICVLDENNIIINILESPCCFEKNHRIFYDWNILGELYSDVEPLDHAKAQYTIAAGMEFAKRRDAITWTQHEVGLYGYDRKPEDVTNFLAAMKRAELGLETGFNVYVDSIGPKQFLPHTYDMFKVVLEQSANEQIAAYQWFEGIKGQLQAATSIEELEQIYPLGGE